MTGRDRIRTVALLGLGFAAAAASSAVSLVQAATMPWGVLAAAAVGAFTLFGPLMWFLRDRLSADQRTFLGAVALVAVGVPVLVGLALVPPNRTGTLLDGLILGVLVGATVAVVLELTVVPPRLRGSLGSDAAES